MLPHPRYLALATGVNSWSTLVEWSADGGRRWAPLPCSACSVSVSASRQWRWEVTATVHGVDTGLGGLHPQGPQLRVQHGLPGLPPIAMGRYKLSRVQQSRLRRDRVQITGRGREIYLIDDDFPGPRTIGPGNALVLLSSLVNEVLPGQVHVDPRLSAARVPPMVVDSRWNTIDGDNDAASLARAVGATVYADAAGLIRVAPPTQFTDPVALDLGGLGLLSAADETISSDDVVNRWVISGESTDMGTPKVGPVIVDDDNGFSPTFVGRPIAQGGFGIRRGEYSSPAITTEAQAFLVGRAKLARSTGVQQALDVGTAHLPWLVADELVRVDEQTVAILDSVDFDLIKGTTSPRVRAVNLAADGSRTDAQ